MGRIADKNTTARTEFGFSLSTSLMQFGEALII
jgi:hypothetical protein